MNILLLEDNPKRIEWFETIFIKENLMVATSVDQAIDFLESYSDISELYLDHDLDGRIFVNSEEPNTGYQLAKYIADSGRIFHRIFVHSMNPYGASNMYNVLKGSATELAMVPFPILMGRQKKIYGK